MKKYRHKHLRGKMKSLKPKKSIFKKRWFWVLVLLLFLAATIFYLIFFFPVIQVQAILISGNEKTKTQDLQDLAWQDFNFRNIFFVNTDKLKQKLLTGFPDIEDMKIQKNWFKALHLEITERKPVAIFCKSQTNENCFLIDKNGVIYQHIDIISDTDFIVRQNTDKSIVTLGQTAVDKNIMTALTKIKDDLKNNFQINVKEADDSNPLIITTTEGWDIYFDREGDIDLEIVKMNTLLKDQISATARKRLQYIYLQYKDRAYYK